MTEAGMTVFEPGAAAVSRTLVERDWHSQNAPSIPCKDRDGFPTRQNGLGLGGKLTHSTHQLIVS